MPKRFSSRLSPHLSSYVPYFCGILETITNFYAIEGSFLSIFPELPEYGSCLDFFAGILALTTDPFASGSSNMYSDSVSGTEFLLLATHLQTLPGTSQPVLFVNV